MVDAVRTGRGVLRRLGQDHARRELPSHIELDDLATGLDQVSYVKCEDVKSLYERHLITRLGTTPLPALMQIELVLRFLLRL